MKTNQLEQETEFIDFYELKEWLWEAKTPEDVQAVLEEYQGREFYFPGFDFAFKVTSIKPGTNPLELTLKAYCKDHPKAQYQQEFFIYGGEGMYNSILDLIEPFRKIHPKH